MSEDLSAPPDAVLRRLLMGRPVVALVGASTRPGRPSHQVLAALIEYGYDVIPVHPVYETVLGHRAHPDLRAIPRPVDLVDVFRRPEFTPDIARDAVAIGAKILWLQVGVVNHEARRIAEAGGLVVVMDRCLSVEHARLVGTPFPGTSDRGC